MGQAATDLTQMSALELAAAIRSKRVSSEEVIEAYLQRIEAVNPSINAVTVVLCEGALRGARRADEAVARGRDLPPLLGVPFTIKENIDVAGTPTTQGAKAAANSYPSRDAPVVERLKAAGAIPIGRCQHGAPSGRAAHRPSLSGGPVPGCGGCVGGPGGDHHPDRSASMRG